MMKNFIIAGIALLSIISCRQDPPPPSQAADCKLATAFFEEVPTQPTFNVVYTNNKITQMTSSTYKVNYEYTNDVLSKKEYFYNSLPDYKYEYTNNNGQITEQKFYEHNGVTYVYKGKQTFTYNAGKLQRMSYFGAANETEEFADYIWTGDNVTSVKAYDSNANLYCTIHYTYNLSKVNDFNTVFPNFVFQNLNIYDWLEIRFLSKNILTQINYTYCNGDVENFNNTFNTQNLMDKVTGAENGADYYRFTYNCQ